MPTHDDVRRILAALPETGEDPDRFAFHVLNKGKAKGIAWVWLERIHPKKARVPNPDVLAVRVADLAEKEALLASDAGPSGSGAIFTEPHYNGYPAVLVRLAVIDAAALGELLIDAWRCQAPKAAVDAFDPFDVA